MRPAPPPRLSRPGFLTQVGNNGAPPSRLKARCAPQRAHAQSGRSEGRRSRTRERAPPPCGVRGGPRSLPAQGRPCEGSCSGSQTGWGLPKRFPESSPLIKGRKAWSPLLADARPGRGGAGLPGRSRPRPPPRTPGPPRARGEGVCSPAPRRRVRRAQTRPGVHPAGGDPRCGREARCASPRPPARCVAWAPVIHLAVPAGPAPASRQLPHPTDSL